MKELKTKKSAEGARVKEKSDALPRAAKRMLRAGLMERQASRQRDTQEKAPERAAEEQVERAALRGGEMAADAGRAVFRQAVPLRAEREKDQWTDAQAVDRYRSASRAAHTDGVGQKTEKISRNREILNRAQEVASRRSDTLRPGAMRQKRTVRDGAHRSSAFFKRGHEIAEASKGASQKQAARQFARQTVQATVQAARSAGRLLAQAGQTAARVASARRSACRGVACFGSGSHCGDGGGVSGFSLRRVLFQRNDTGRDAHAAGDGGAERRILRPHRSDRTSDPP